MTTQVIEIESTSLLEARSKLRSRIPEHYEIVSEQVLPLGKVTKLRAFGPTSTAVVVQTPPNTELVSAVQVSSRRQRTVYVEAFDYDTATLRAKQHLGAGEIIDRKECIISARRGFLGIATRIGRWEVTVSSLPEWELTYVTQIKLVVSIAPKAIVTAERLRSSGTKKGDPRVEASLSDLLARGLITNNAVPDELLAWLIDRIYFSSSGRAALFQKLTATLLSSYTSLPKSWASVLSVPVRPQVEQIDIAPLLRTLIWYLMRSSGEQQDSGALRTAQDWFLEVVSRDYAAIQIELRESVLRTLEHLIHTSSPRPPYRIVARSCMLLAEKGGASFLRTVLAGVEQCDAEYTASLRQQSNSDWDLAAAAADASLKEWKQFKATLRFR